MSIEFRTCEAGDLAAAINPIWHYFGRGPSEEDAERLGQVLPTDRVHVAVEDGKVVGGAGAYKFDTTVPGGARVPTAGVMAVGVLPTHRRRGILRGLMRKEIDDVREWGEPLATLYASEGAIYRRYGYGPGVHLRRHRAPVRERVLLRDASVRGTTLRMVTLAEALELFPTIYDRVAAETAGMLSRTREWWETRKLATGPWMKGELFMVVLEIDGEPEGYADVLDRVGYGAHGLPFGPPGAGGDRRDAGRDARHLALSARRRLDRDREGGMRCRPTIRSSSC